MMNNKIEAKRLALFEAAEKIRHQLQRGHSMQSGIGQLAEPTNAKG